MNRKLTERHIDKVLAYLSPYLKLINCHMVDFLTENLWEKFIPEDIRIEIRSDEDIDGGVKLFLRADENRTQYPLLQKFIAETEQLRLENMHGVILAQSDLFKSVGLDVKLYDDDYLYIKEFMNEKKNHEVEVVSRLVSKLISNLNGHARHEVYVLDAGDGKGYLSSRLALEYGLNVLGIDASEVNTEGAQKRMKKLQRAWSGLKERTEILNMGLIPPRRSKKRNDHKSNKTYQSSSAPSSAYKSVNCYITKETNFDQLISHNFDTTGDFITCLTGLHTCGNLASTCLEAFANNERIKLLCNIGCCYHLIAEEFSTGEFFANKELTAKCVSYGFPMSNYLRSKKVQLGRNARMLASQSIHRTQSKSVLNTQSLFYRAVLEVIVRDRYPELNESLKVGKVKNFSTFKEYLGQCDDKCTLNLRQLEEDYINAMIQKYKCNENLLNIYYLIRMSFAQIVETLILLDRLLFLKENNVERSFLIRLFDPVKSPRCYGIIAFK